MDPKSNSELNTRTISLITQIQRLHFQKGQFQDKKDQFLYLLKELEDLWIPQNHKIWGHGEHDLEDEIWKQVPGYAAYEVSTCGRVRSFYKRTGGNWCISNEPQRLLKYSNNRRYLSVSLRKSNEGKFISVQQRVAHLVMLTFIGPRPDGNEICHSDGNPSNNQLSNLRYDTHLGNMADSYHQRRGRFTEVQVFEMRNLAAQGKTRKEIAELFEIKKLDTVSDICSGKRYADFPGPITKSFPFVYGRLAPEQVRKIRMLREQGKSLRQISTQFRISLSTVSRICSRSRWMAI